MANDSHVPAMLKVLHSDILLPGEDERAEEISDEEIPPTRSEAQSGFPVGHERCTIGRNPDSAIRIRRERTDISRAHATIVPEGTHFRIVDHSTRGTFVNDQRVEGSRLLVSGDVLGFGDSPRMLRFVDLERPGVVLTNREQEILNLLALAQTNKEIAATLHISPETVNSHVQRLFEKLGVHNRTEAVMMAQAHGLLVPRPSRDP
jgi:DNA-binding CsgD family transcriptional regulator